MKGITTVRILLRIQILILLSVGMFVTPAMAIPVIGGYEGNDPVQFYGTIYNQDGSGPMADKYVLVCRYILPIIQNTYDDNCYYYQGISETTTASDGKYQTGFAVFPPEGLFGLWTKGTSGQWILLDNRQLTQADFKDLGELNWNYNWNFPIPEFQTIVMPIIAVIGLMFMFQRQKGK